MEPEQQKTHICELSSSESLLALYTTVYRNVLHQRVPHTRSVYVTRVLESGGGDNDNKKSLLLIQGLPFVLYCASDGELTADELSHWAQQSYGIELYSKRAMEAARAERDTLLASMNQTPQCFSEYEWVRCLDDAERRVLFERGFKQTDGHGGDDTGALLFSQLLGDWHQLQEMNVQLGLRQDGAKIFSNYRRLQDPVRDRRSLDADAFFCVRAIESVALQREWPCASKLKDRQVWALHFEDHRALEHFVHKFNWPLEIGGQWYPERVPGREVSMIVLEPTDWHAVPHSLRLYERKKGTGTHEYALAQTPRFSEKMRTQWHFPQHSAALVSGGLLQPAFFHRQSTGRPLAEMARQPDLFGGLCALARHNKLQVRSNRMTLDMAQALDDCDCLFLVDYGERREVRVKRDPSAIVVVPYTQALNKQLMATGKSSSASGRKRIDLKRHAADELPPVQSNAKKKQKHETTTKQSSMWDYYAKM